MTFLYTQESANPYLPIGGKARSLAILGQAGAPVPRWLVITPDAFFESLQPGQVQAFEAWATREDQAPITDWFQFKPEIRDALASAISGYFKPGAMLAVRSSAMEEDGAEASYAGQFESYLYVPVSQALEKVLAVWQSGFSPQVMSYRKSKGLDAVPMLPAVVVQEMVHATASGVAFGADPVTGNPDVVVISSLYGLGTALVSGACDADLFHRHREQGEIYQHIAHKPTAARHAPQSPDGVALQPVPEHLADKPSLTGRQLALLEQWTRYCNLTMGCAQDIEWAYCDDLLYLLQSRPITTPVNGDPSPYYYFWSDHDMDSWMGVTTPLTFSFIRRFYEAKFQHLSRHFGVSSRRIQQDRAIYKRMVGLVRGRIYFNTASLEAVWDAVPGFKRYRVIFNDWIGIENATDLPSPPTGSWSELALEAMVIAKTLFGLFCLYRRWNQAMREFNGEVNKLLTLTNIELGRMSMDRLVLLYHRLEGMLARQWEKPTINNFFAGFFYTQLANCTAGWCQDQDYSLRDSLICGEGDITSTRPLRAMEQLAWLALEHDGLAACLAQASLADIEAEISKAPQFDYHYRQYLQEYGQRCHESSLLESPNIADEPLVLLRSVGFYARRLKESGQARPEFKIGAPSAVELEIRRSAEAEAELHLKGHPIRRLIFNFVLRHARARVKDRENIRYVQTLVMGRFRQIVLALGKRFQALNLLENAEDIFYLELEEAIGYVEGTLTCPNLKGLVALRRAEFDQFRQMEPVPSDFSCRSSIFLDDLYEIFTDDGPILANGSAAVEAENRMVLMNSDELAGFGCSPGVKRGPIVFVNGQAKPELKGGEILVAELGDPGLVMLFGAAGGLLFEKGSPLSHLSIVAREMGIPTIVSIDGLKSWLKDGDWVEMDGRTGLVRKVSVD